MKKKVGTIFVIAVMMQATLKYFHDYFCSCYIFGYSFVKQNVFVLK